MTSPSKREQGLLLLLPLALVLIGYAARMIYFPDTTRAAVERLQARMGEGTQGKEAVGNPLLAVLSQQRELLEQVAARDRELAELEARRARLTRGIDDLARPLAGDENPTVAMRQLGDLLRRHGLVLERSSPAIGEAARDLPRILSEAVAAAPKGTEADAARGRLWQLEFTGNYRDVMAALDELGAPSGCAMPVSLAMAEVAADQSRRLWTLVVWL